ncbi:MAG: hypothetical protein ACRDQ4_06255 [Pseudonocardiaceae bacterium]
MQFWLATTVPGFCLLAADAEQDPLLVKVAGPVERTATFRNYLECHVGSRRDADRAFAEADPLLRALPMWHADAKLDYGRALVKGRKVTILASSTS